MAAVPGDGGGPRDRQRPDNRHATAHRDDDARLAEDHPENIRAGRAEGHAYAELPRPLGNHVTDHAEDAQGGQGQREEAEAAQINDRPHDRPTRKLGEQLLVEAPDGVERLALVHAPDGGPGPIQ